MIIFAFSDGTDDKVSLVAKYVRSYGASIALDIINGGWRGIYKDEKLFVSRTKNPTSKRLVFAGEVSWAGRDIHYQELVDRVEALRKEGTSQSLLNNAALLSSVRSRISPPLTPTFESNAQLFVRIANKEKIKFERNVDQEPNQGWSAGLDVIGLSKFADPSVELAAFFHELGHIYVAREGQKCGNKIALCTLSSEGAAWEKGFSLAASYGYTFAYDSHVCQWARYQLKTYLRKGSNAHIELYGE